MSVPARKILATFEPARQRKIQQQAAKLIAEEAERQRAHGNPETIPAELTAPSLAPADIDGDNPL